MRASGILDGGVLTSDKNSGHLTIGGVVKAGCDGHEHLLIRGHRVIRVAIGDDGKDLSNAVHVTSGRVLVFDFGKYDKNSNGSNKP